MTKCRRPLILAAGQPWWLGPPDHDYGLAQRTLANGGV
jgi:hypothetical protein